MKLSKNLDQAILDAKEIMKDKKNVQVKFTVKKNGVEVETSAIYLRKINPERIEQLKKELPHVMCPFAIENSMKLTL